MIKRIRQNKSLRPSNRQKFKESNREAIYTRTHAENRASFKEFPESQVKATIKQIREEAKSERRKALFFYAIVIAIITAITLYVLLPSHT